MFANVIFIGRRHHDIVNRFLHVIVLHLLNDLDALLFDPLLHLSPFFSNQSGFTVVLDWLVLQLDLQGIEVDTPVLEGLSIFVLIMNLEVVVEYALLGYPEFFAAEVAEVLAIRHARNQVLLHHAVIIYFFEMLFDGSFANEVPGAAITPKPQNPSRSY